MKKKDKKRLINLALAIIGGSIILFVLFLAVSMLMSFWFIHWKIGIAVTSIFIGAIVSLYLALEGLI